MTQRDERAHPRDGNRPSFASSITLLGWRGRREDRVAAAPGALAQKKTAQAQEPRVRRWSHRPSLRDGLRLIRALVSAKSARMCERAVLTNRPSLDLSPYVLKGRKSLTGS